jgi:hypothetical protein
MTSEQRTRYETMRQMAKDELDHLDKELGGEVLRAKQRIEELQRTKKVIKQIYDDTCSLLGIKSVVDMQDYALEDVEKHA